MHATIYSTNIFLERFKIKKKAKKNINKVSVKKQILHANNAQFYKGFDGFMLSFKVESLMI